MLGKDGPHLGHAEEEVLTLLEYLTEGEGYGTGFYTC